MPGLSRTDALQARFRAAADEKALSAVIRYSDLRGEQALRVARQVVTAASPDLRTMYAQKMGGTSAKEATTAGMLITAAVAAEVAAYIALFRQAGPKTKVLAAGGLAMNMGMFAYGRFKQHQIRRSAVVELAATRGPGAVW
jgi:hypothetical protein